MTIGPVVDFSPYADDFVAHYASVRGQVRLRLLHQQVGDHLPDAARVLDIGGGAGHLARWLAGDGHRVTVLEPSPGVLGPAATRVEVVAGDAADAAVAPHAGAYDAVLCHAVAPYVDDLGRLLADVVAAAAPGGLVSVVVKNRDALAMRPALEGRWADVPGAVGADGDAGGLGVRNRAHSLDEVTTTLAGLGCHALAWYGIRVVSDALPYDADADVDEVTTAEAALAVRDPYRALGRLLHVVARCA